MMRWAIGLLFGVAFVGCARHVVVDPDRVGSMNSTDWKIELAPQPSSGESPPTPSNH